MSSMLRLLDKLTWMGQFNYYRQLYSKFSFEDRQKLYTLWYKAFPDGAEPFDGQFVLDCIDEIISDNGHYLRVHELGGYRGELAWEVLSKHPRITWTSFDIIKHDILPELPDNFSECVLEKELWETNIGLEGDVFISMHTLEHLSDADFDKLLAYILKQKITHLILQLPIQPEGQTWANYLGAHVLTYGSNKIKKLLEPRYKLVREVPRDESGEDIRKWGGWCSFWVRK